jgi:hypothetical protein
MFQPMASPQHHMKNNLHLIAQPIASGSFQFEAIFSWSKVLVVAVMLITIIIFLIRLKNRNK